MNHIIKIENKPNQRIIINIEPEKEILNFIGQYKPHNKEWINICEISQIFWINKEDNELITADIIQKKLIDTYDLIKKRIDAYNNIIEGIISINSIEIEEN